jgi:hypothetical protein
MTKSLTEKQSIAQITAFFKRNGYVRFQNPERLNEGHQNYKKGNEVRLVANSDEELAHIQELLHTLAFTSGRPFAKRRQFNIPIYGREQISRFLSLVGYRHT